ncbi:type I DNA topoisomerase [methanotrophic endosymbiont of Bathymodiolus puteoserpentis (Logatchev)]|jgi:DNA topoisomerase-1|uniref:type I DNA topoisomerase n=1 Tax=methanotrophic endosymbiont of Bathymodiolus puteoserpentis (Logatchev) TaxID=343235 RepID=UPI0013C68F1F|nr:type I DNA topoisomerase [methanotrophic endosymbiont of Bathymodiolus puteoserpentis (Logatchev)]SHE19991.1 DNA topoisomerase I [methanotrophic endosymbiont of Bathymodiolus puteoserpentis (Logatchev)]
MSKNLIIVESPAKSKTIEKYLGKDFQVLASYGHLRDLIPKEGAVDPDNDFAMKYQIQERNQRHVQAITKALKGADTLYLATDPDREGEAISWHLLEILKAKKLLKAKTVHRVVFHEITKKAVTYAIENPGEIATNLVDAQQARRALDYLVGFNLSPLLWKKIRRGLSAGRVQSPALRMIVERELEIEAFKTREYWSITAKLIEAKQPFKAKLTHYNGEKLSQFSIENDETAQAAQQALLAAANGSLKVAKLEKKQRKRNPAPPFITSTLQQEAARKLGFTTKRTMMVAQQLYEGMDIGGGEAAGLITYMRTDSVNLAAEALENIRALISEKYGADQIPKEPRSFKTKSKNAQEAHEAIRPTLAQQTPASLKTFLSSDQFKLYDLIWKRTIACQMIHATINTVSVDLQCGSDQHIFRATGSVIAKPGFMAVYLEGQDDNKEGDDKETFLPPMKEGQSIPLEDIVTNQHFTEPPPRYSEASLVKSLEEHGIGRPSTYASIISTLQNREYVTLEKKRFYPTDVGRIVIKFLTEHFTKYVDYNFTANLEDDLDAVSRGEKSWVPLMHDFWKPFTALIHDKEESVQRKDVTQEAIDEKCPECGKQLSIRLGRNGRFIGCTDYPTCSYTRNLNDDGTQANEPEIVPDRKCPSCESDLVIKTGKYGKFIGCSAYPKCKHIEPLEKPLDTGVECPKCKTGSILKRKSRYGKIFYSCSDYPKCDYALWNVPVNEPCPACDWPILTLKTTKRRGPEKVCPQKDCKYATPYEGDPEDVKGPTS